MLGLNFSAADTPAFAPRDTDRGFRAPADGYAQTDRRPAAAVCPHRVARWACGEGLRGGDAVALLVRDLAQAEALRLGLTRISVRVACFDLSLRGEALAGSVNASGAVLAIVDTALAEAYAGVMGRLQTYPAVWWNGPGADFARLDLALAEQE